MRNPHLLRVGKRLLTAVLLVLCVSFGTFALFQLVPGSAASLVGGDQGASPEEVAAAKQRLGLDRSFVVQYGDWLGDAARGDFGRSFLNDRPVTELVRQRFPVTLSLTLSTIFLVIPIGTLLGVMAGANEGRKLDRLVTAWCSLSVAMPGFWFGLLLALYIAVKADLLPAGGYVSIFDNPVEFLRHMLLPALTLATPLSASLSRQLRASMAATLAQDYIRSSDARGMPRRVVLLKHALRNAALPAVTLLGLQFISLLGGTIIAEAVFALPGMGSLVISAVQGRDVPVIQGVVLMASMIAIVVSMTMDSVYRKLDPRIQVT